MPRRFAIFLLIACAMGATDAPVAPDVGAKWAENWSAKRLDDVMSLYAPDAIFFATDGGRFAGTVALREFFRKTLASNDPTIHMHRVTTELSGKLAYESGDYQETIVSSGHRIQAHGDYLLILRNQGGRWLIVDQMFTGVFSPLP
jgi:ketosteroid isomerase-like protein